MTAPSPTTALPDADAGRRNMTLLIQLRWLAVGGQLATIAVVIGLMDIALPLAPLLAAVAVLAAINGVSLLMLRRRRAVTNAELTAALLFDVAALRSEEHTSELQSLLRNSYAVCFLKQK